MFNDLQRKFDEQTKQLKSIVCILSSVSKLLNSLYVYYSKNNVQRVVLNKINASNI